MMKNKELFQRDPTTSKLLNDGVAAVKDAVTEQERETLRYELSHFVCEGQYKDGIVRILESYMGNINSATQLAAWISGFYGSGKSHLEKMLRHLWVDTQFPETGETARGLAHLPAEVKELLSLMGDYAPPLFWADGASTVEFLLTGLCTELASRLDFRPSGPPGTLAPVFFAGQSHETASVEFRSTPFALAGWLAGLTLGTDAYQYRFQVREATQDQPAFRLSVDLRPKVSGGSLAWVPLDEAAARPDAVEALGLAALLGDFVPELADLRTRRTLVLAEDRLTSFLADAAPVLGRLGIEVVLPKALSKLLSPRLTVAVRSKGEGLPGGSLGVEDLVEYEWAVTIGDQVLTRRQFETLVRQSRGLVRFKDGYVTLDAEQMRKLLEPAGRSWVLVSGEPNASRRAPPTAKPRPR